MNDNATKFSSELNSFKDLWDGGYYEGDPLDPMGRSSYGLLGFMSVLHATYLRCIKPYVNKNTVALEIGPGRGAWTKTLLASKEIYVLDALPEEHNRFFEYLGHPRNVKYIQVQDFSCEMLPDDRFTFMFSFGCYCHVSFKGMTEYAKNLYPKLRKGCNCFWMVADYEKKNKAFLEHDKLNVSDIIIPPGRRYLPIKWLLHVYGLTKFIPQKADQDDEPRPGRWYHAGNERTCSMLKEVGYRIVDPDVGTSHRDPIIHFIKD